MRPIKLTMSAFGPYANKQVIDFEELKGRNIFVISGKTGSGKTTIFDAISYALYGEASGESREADSLRSHFADDDVETFVELEFELRGEKYIVNRVPRQKKPSQKKKKSREDGYTDKKADATLTLPNGKTVTKVKAVTEKIEEILGITKDQFRQIVMLPQGEFKKLLLAKSDEREVIFRKIFNTYDFEKIQIELSQKAKTLNNKRSKSKDKMHTNLENIKGEHDIELGDYVDFPFVIEKLKELISKYNEKYDMLKDEVKNLDNNLEEKGKEEISIKANNDLLNEKEKIIKTYENLLAQKEEFNHKKEDLNNAKKAKEVKYTEDKSIEYKKKLDTRNEDYKKSLANIDKLDKEHKISKENLKLEEAKDDQRDKLNIEIDNLISIEPKISKFDELNNEVSSSNDKIKKIKVDIEDKKVLIEKLKKEKIEKENKLKEIATLETTKVKLENDTQNKNKVIQDTRELFISIDKYESGLTKHSDLSEEYKKFEKNYISIKNKYESMDDLYKKEQAGILASKLEENRPCPVCGSTNHPNPATINNYENIPTEEELKKEKVKLEEIEKQNTEKLNNLTALNSDNKNNLDIVNGILEKISKILNIEDSYFQGISNTVKAKGIELKNEIVKLRKELDKVNEKIALKDKINNKIKDIESKITQSEKDLEVLAQDEKKYLKEATELATKIESYKKEIPKDIKDIKTLKNLINIKTEQLKESKQKLKNLRAESEEISKKLEREDSTSKEISKSVKELIKDIENIKLEFEGLMKKQGFEEVKDYEEAKLIIPKIEKLEKEVKEYETNLNILKSKREDIVNKTKDLVIIDLSNIQEEIKKLRELKKEMDTKLRETYSIVDNNKDVLKNVETLNIEFKEIEEQYKIVGELADLANGKKSPYISFERYILASYFEDIIDAANIRLEKMTGDRFSLIRKKSKSKGAGQKGLELEIYDNYTDSCRDVSSLSGGESFKASLSLALGLSDVVQSNAGGVSLDTMFVDEGFGTLDPQSLDNAIDSLLDLQRGGRLVGIISHVEELKERMEAKLEVVSTLKGSKAEFNIL